MAKNSVYKNKSPAKTERKKENTLDYYIAKVSADTDSTRWWSESEEKESAGEESITHESKKHEFLKKNIKATAVIPPHTRKEHSIPNKMGYFETRFGTVEVGYKKYNKYGNIAFSLVPDSLKETSIIPQKKLKDPNNYFGGETGGRKTRFKASKISFKYNPRNKEVQKLEEDQDGIADKETKLLYQDKKEEETIENLKSERNKESTDKRDLEKRLARVRDIKEEKEEDNLAFLKVIDNFIDSMKKNKLKKIIDSDDAIMRRKRIIELSGSPNLREMNVQELRELLKEILKREGYKKLPDEFSKVDIKKLTKTQLQKLIKNLAGKLSGDETLS